VQNAAGTSHDNTFSFSYNPASQITSRTRTNSVYDWTTPGSSGTTTVNYADNGLDQYTNVGGVTPDNVRFLSQIQEWAGGSPTRP
jgi:hypothetical protein